MTVTRNTQCHQMSLFNPNQPLMLLPASHEWSHSVIKVECMCLRWVPYMQLLAIAGAITTQTRFNPELWGIRTGIDRENTVKKPIFIN